MNYSRPLSEIVLRFVQVTSYSSFESSQNILLFDENIVKNLTRDNKNHRWYAYSVQSIT